MMGQEEHSAVIGLSNLWYMYSATIRSMGEPTMHQEGLLGIGTGLGPRCGDLSASRSSPRLPTDTYVSWMNQFLQHVNVFRASMKTHRGKYGFNPALAASCRARRTRSVTASMDMPNLWVNGKIASVFNNSWVFPSFASPILRCLASGLWD